MIINILGFEGHWASVMMAQFCHGRAKVAIFWDNLWRSNSDQNNFYSGSWERRLSLVDFVLQVTSQSVACIWVRCPSQCPHLWLGTLVMRNRHGALKEALDRKLSKHVWPVPLNWLQPTFQTFSIDALSQAQLLLLSSLCGLSSFAFCPQCSCSNTYLHPLPEAAQLSRPSWNDSFPQLEAIVFSLLNIHTTLYFYLF